MKKNLALQGMLFLMMVMLTSCYNDNEYDLALLRQTASSKALLTGNLGIFQCQTGAVNFRNATSQKSRTG
jgi:hypothetical protein